MKLFKKISACVAGLCLVLMCTPRAFAVSESLQDAAEQVKQGGSAVALTALGVLILMFAAMAVVAKLGKDGRINVPWGILAALLSALAMLVCVVGVNAGTLYSKTQGDPADTVNKFFDSLIAQDYESAYSCLGDYSSLGLENEPEGETGKMLYDAIKDSYDYMPIGSPITEKYTAKQSVRFRHLNLPAVESDVAEETQRNLRKAVKDNPTELVYDENDHFLPNVTEKAYSDAMKSVLSQREKYYTADTINVELNYVGGKWLIMTDKDMLNALVGTALY